MAAFEARGAIQEIVASAAAGERAVDEALIRHLHRALGGCLDATINEAVPGEYRTSLGFLVWPNGSSQEGAPSALVGAEMRRLMEELGRPGFVRAHPVLQASYSSYSLTKIHPFPDGNGRIARALASTYLERSSGVGLPIFLEQRFDYGASLRAAEGGDYEAFVEFVLSAALNGMRLEIEAIRAIRTADPKAAVGRLEALLASMRRDTAREPP